MKYSLIRYNKTVEGIEWEVFRKGKRIDSGVTKDFDSAVPIAEKSNCDAFKAEKIHTKILLWAGDQRLSLMKTNK